MAVVINSPWDAKLFKEQREKARKSINSAHDANKFYETYGGNGQSGNWGSPLRNVGKEGYYYNPKTYSWEKASYSTPTFNLASGNTSYNSSSMSNSGGGSSGALSQTGVANTSNSANTSSRTSAEKEYIDVEFNTLTGECSVLPTKEAMKLKVGDTVKIKGIGKYLSGQFFIAGISRTIDSSGGYSMSLSLIRNGFGDSLKKAVTPPAPVDTGAKDTSKNVVNNSIKVGDKVKIVGADAVYSNAHDGVKVPEWVKGQQLTVDAISDDGKRARLNPIWSWTYIKYLKHI